MKKDKKAAAGTEETKAAAETVETTETAAETAAETETVEEIQVESENQSEDFVMEVSFKQEENPVEENPVEENPVEENPVEENPEKIKSKRGRKAGGKNKPKEIQPELFPEDEEIKKQIFGKKKEQKTEEKAEEKKPEEQPKQLFAVSGEMLLGAIDFTAPLLITTAGGFLDKDIKKVKVESLQLDETEKKALLPAAEAVARENIRLSAMEMLLSGLLIIYTGKIYQAVKEIKANK